MADESNRVPIPEGMQEQFQSRRQKELDHTEAEIRSQLTKGDSMTIRVYKNKATGEPVTILSIYNGIMHCASGTGSSYHVFPMAEKKFEREYEPLDFTHGPLTAAPPIEAEKEPTLPDTEQVPLRTLIAAGSNVEAFAFGMMNGLKRDEQYAQWAKNENKREWTKKTASERFIYIVARLKVKIADETLRVLKETEE